MNNLIGSLVDNSVQCWGCPMFDRLFQIVSAAATAAYSKFTFLCIIIFCILFAFFTINAVWQNIKGGAKDKLLSKSVQKVFINSVVAMAFLGLGIYVPRFVSTITFEPVAQITLKYTQSMLQINDDTVNEKVSYQPMNMPDNQVFRPQLRDTIILLMKTTITQFQSYMKLGIAVIESAFSWRALLGIGALIKHIILVIIGIYIFYNFFKLFIRFCFYFIDIIVAMLMFAFFFPLSLAMVAFRDAENVPEWMAGLGKSLGTGQIKKLINAIVALGSAVLTYTIIMMIIAKFFSTPDISVNDLMTAITSGNIFDADLSDDNLAALTLGSVVVLLYIVNYIANLVPEITKMVLSAFDVDEEKGLSKEMADNVMGLSNIVMNSAKNIGKKIISGGEKPKTT